MPLCTRIVEGGLPKMGLSNIILKAFGKLMCMLEKMKRQ